MSHQDEYYGNMITMLELIWGEGYMAPGGSGNVEKMLNGIETEEKRILDIGCGLGGPAFEMAKTFGADVVGIDLESPLIERATETAIDMGLQDRCKFHTVEAGKLDFPNLSFDIVVSSGAITQVKDKADIFTECYRVLKSGGYLTCYDWTKSEGPLSTDMFYWFEMEGLTYALETLEEYKAHLNNLGFIDVTIKDASNWYHNQVRSEYDLVKGSLYPLMVESLGKKDADHFVENWRAMLVVCEKGEMRQGYCRGRKP